MSSATHSLHCLWLILAANVPPGSPSLTSAGHSRMVASSLEAATLRPPRRNGMLRTGLVDRASVDHIEDGMFDCFGAETFCSGVPRRGDIATRWIARSGCAKRRPSRHITDLLQCGEHPVDHVVWIPTCAQEFELKHCALDLAGPACPGGVGVLLYGVID